MRTQLLSLLLLSLVATYVSAKSTASLGKTQTHDGRDDQAQEVARLQQQVNQANQQIDQARNELRKISNQLIYLAIRPNPQQEQSLRQQESQLNSRVRDLERTRDNIQVNLNVAQNRLNSFGYDFVQSALKNKKASQKVIAAKN